LPLALYLLKEESEDVRKQVFESFVKITHNNKNCFYHSFALGEVIRGLLLGGTVILKWKVDYENKADVINTTSLVLHNYNILRNEKISLLEKLCKVVNLGNDTDTNTALVGALLGIDEELEASQKEKILGMNLVNEISDAFIAKLNL